jgi:hypothetical protein
VQATGFHRGSSGEFLAWDERSWELADPTDDEIDTSLDSLVAEPAYRLPSTFEAEQSASRNAATSGSLREVLAPLASAAKACIDRAAAALAKIDPPLLRPLLSLIAKVIASAERDTHHPR